jgi:molybdenum cofactor biosynthesis enzyme MoaA
MSPATVPVHVSCDQTLRVKVIDACGLACTFCHNEGTPVTIDNQRRPFGQFTSTGHSGRVSIYAETNGAAFLAAPIPADNGFAAVLAQLRDALDLRELHLTGGEPTVHPAVAKLVRIGVEQGYAVRMTSNGENGAAVLAGCAEAGLSKVNFSIFGTTAAELAAVQHARYQNAALAERKIQALKQSIARCARHGVQANANLVVPDHSHAPRVHRLLEEYAPELSVRLLNSLDHGQASVQAIHDLLADLDAEPEARYLTAGASGARTVYRLPDDRRVVFKEIRAVRLPDTCADCRFNNGRDCHEGFYGVRLYRDRGGRYLVGVCIQRMDLCLPVAEFIASPLRREILRLREREYATLTAQAAR